MKARRMLALAMVVAAWSVPAGVAVAGKKPAPPPPPPPLPAGKVYFITGGSQGLMWTMNPDGSAKTSLPVGVPNVAGDSQNAHPSFGMHAGHRWFLGSRTIPGEYFPGGVIQRRTIVAVRDDGAIVTDLFAQADMLVATAYSRWSRDDAMISLVGARYVGGVLGPYGIYTASVVFDADGNVAGLAGQPVEPSVSLSSANVMDTDWSPDGRIVASVGGALWIADLATGGTTLLPTSLAASGPAWSPDGTRVAFSCRLANGTPALRSITASGSSETTIVTTASSSAGLSNPSWSPNGAYLVYGYGNLNPDVYRVPAVGGTPVNLTADVSVYTSTWGWR